MGRHLRNSHRDSDRRTVLFPLGKDLHLLGRRHGFVHRIE